MTKKRQKKATEPSDKRNITFVVRVSENDMQELTKFSDDMKISRNQIINDSIKVYMKYVKELQDANQLTIPFEVNKKV